MFAEPLEIDYFLCMNNMTDTPNLTTIFSFKEKDYLVKMYVINSNTLELSVSDKCTTEEWKCSYDASYIENLTHKTGNYKPFDVFTTMLKSGLLKTSECLSLDLLTLEDLEFLRSRRVSGKASCGLPRSSALGNSENRRYLILTYSVEFDRIHYPLPLEYCGPPDPKVLQSIIRRLEAEIERLQSQLLSKVQHDKDSSGQVARLQKRVEELLLENKTLTDEIRNLNKILSKHSSSYRQMECMQSVLKTLEHQVIQERSAFQKLVQKLRDEKTRLQHQISDLQTTERSLRIRLQQSFQCTNPVQNAPLPSKLPYSLASRPPGDSRSINLTACGQFETQNVRPLNKGIRTSPTQKCTLQHRPNVPHRKPPLPPSQTQSLGCCQRNTARHCRSSSGSSSHSRKATPPKISNRKPDNLRSQVINNAHKPNCIIPHGASNAQLRTGKSPQKKQPSRRRSSSECSTCSCSRSACNKRCCNSSSSSSSLHSLVTGSRGSKQKHYSLCSCTSHATYKRETNQDVQHGMSDLENRIKALQRILKEGLPIK